VSAQPQSPEYVGTSETTQPELASPFDEERTDDIFNVFANRRRRDAFHYLKQCEANTDIDVSDLSTQVAAWEHDVDPDRLDYDERKSVHTSLYQFHIPKMDDAGLVDFERQTSTVSLTETGEEIDVYLETVSEDEIPWSSYFLGLSVVNAGFVGLHVSNLLSVPSIAIAVAIVVTFLASSLVFWYYTRNEMQIGTDGEPPTGA
jgi:hypothetical protein